MVSWECSQCRRGRRLPESKPVCPYCGKGKKKNCRAHWIEFTGPSQGRRVRKRLEGYTHREALEVHDELRAKAKKRARSGRKGQTHYRTVQSVIDNYVANLAARKGIDSKTVATARRQCGRFIKFIGADTSRDAVTGTNV
ncbi:hypothetical protein ACFL2Q_15435 [Thermodesulfobacteriota bacterium]